MPSKIIEEQLKQAGQKLKEYGAELKQDNYGPQTPPRQAEQVSSKEGKLSEPVAEHLASHERAKQGNAMDQALQNKPSEKTKDKEPDLER